MLYSFGEEQLVWVCAKRNGREITALFDVLGEVVCVRLPCFFTMHLPLAGLAAADPLASYGVACLTCGLYRAYRSSFSVGVVPQLLCRIAVCHALLFAIPSLDLVLTPNGFGIVNNQNIVPASKERVERLIATIEKQRDDTIILLLEKLRKKAQWVDSDAGRYWAETLFPNIDVCERMGIKEHLWDGYQRLRPQIIAIETLIANGFISPELMHDLHGYQFGEVYNSLSADAKSA